MENNSLERWLNNRLVLYASYAVIGAITLLSVYAFIAGERFAPILDAIY